jgi:hypothetical protein
MATNQTLDFSKMLFDVSQVPQGTDLIQKFPRLAVYDEFALYGGTPAGLPHRDNTISYIFYAYDKRCPLHEIKTLPERTDKCLIMAGFKKNNKNEWSDEIQKMVVGAIPEVNKMIRCFLFKIQNCRKFNVYNGMEKALQDIIENMHSPIEDLEADKKERAFKLKIENSESAVAMINSLENLEKELFMDDEVIKEIAHGTDLKKSDYEEGYAEKFARQFRGKK